MGGHTHSGQVERLEVVETGRRRRWSEAEKLRIVTESLSGRRLVSSTARRYGISTSLLYTWRRALGSGQLVNGKAASAFVPALIVPDIRPEIGSVGSSGRMEIVATNGRRVIVDAGVDVAALARVLDLLERR
jgi:transposase